MVGFYTFASVLIVVLYLLRKQIASAIYWCLLASDEEVRLHRDGLRQLTRVKRQTDVLFDKKLDAVLNEDTEVPKKEEFDSPSTDDSLPASEQTITLWHN